VIVIEVEVDVVVESLETEIKMNALRAIVNRKKMIAKHKSPTIR